MFESNGKKIDPNRPHLILCEGADVIWLLDFFKNSDEKFEQFWAYDFGGVDNLKSYLDISIARINNFKMAKSICVIRDAEKDAYGACQSIRDALKDKGFPVPSEPCSWVRDNECKHSHISTGFVLFPDCNSTPGTGTLEDLCLRILSKEGFNAILSDADKAIEPYKDVLPRLHKNRLHTFFSLTDEFVSLKIGEAAKAKAFDYDRPEITHIKTFLLQAVDV